ncbi:MAG TPA: PAS domain S-box protein [Cyclobacteriaceae bacterium]|nr:PAS domain S-box protein [Cyclobacteriaceae bacterium]
MQDLIKHLPAVIYEYAIFPDGRQAFTFISPSCKTILGIEAEDILRDPAMVFKLIHDDDRQSFRDSADLCYTQGKQWHWQGRMYLNDQQRWVEVSGNYENRPDGSVLRRGILQDITDRRISAKESEIRYQSMVKRLPIGILIYVDEKVVFTNDLALQVLGLSRSRELIGKGPEHHIHADHREQALERINTVHNGGTVPVIEQIYLGQDGREIHVEEMIFPFMFRDRKAVQVIFRDITEKKLTEAIIRKNETLFTQLFNSIPMATVMLDGQGKVLQINDGFKEMFGFELEELRGNNLNDHIVPEELRGEGIDLNNLITASRVISVETVRKHKRGHTVNVILYGVPVMQDNETIGIYGVYVDITDRMKVEEELKVRNAELDNFVYKVSHDLRAPLSSILGLVNLAKVPGNPDDLSEYIDLIGTKVEHLDHFISDVLSHSKNLKMEVSLAKVEMAQIIDRTFSDLHYLRGAREMLRHVKVEGVDFYSDPWRIMEIFRNLISNAIKYRQMNGSRTPEVWIKVHVDNLRADISFADNGIGISQENLNRIFEMFFRATEQSDGSGIGLYIVKNAVEKLGGQISVASKQGEGTRFNIVLPNRIANSLTKSVPLIFEQRE